MTLKTDRQIGFLLNEPAFSPEIFGVILGDGSYLADFRFSVEHTAVNGSIMFTSEEQLRSQLG
jgi:hypothetical protein